MKEIVGNIFDIRDADAICVTTNGVVKSNGELVMGAGIAKQFAVRYPGLALRLGYWVRKSGNHVIADVEDYPGPQVVTFPTKHHWQDPSDLGLIQQSARELKDLCTTMGWTKVVLPRVGTGLGQLPWTQVKAVLDPILDDRFYVITPKEGM